MIAESLLSLVGGGVLRLVPEVMGFFDKKNERKHELAMTDKQLELRKVESANALALASAQHESAVDAGMINALIEAQKAQGNPSGIKWVDAVNSMVRPSVTFAYFGLYATVRLVTVVMAIYSSPAAFATAIQAAWTAEDNNMLAAILGFWFCNRSLIKGK